LTRRRVRVVPLSLALAFAAVGPATVRAQTAAECAAYAGAAGRVCTAAVDATRAIHPFLGILISGGNPLLGSGSALGGLGRFSVTARVNAVEVTLPRLSYDGSSPTVPRGQKVFAPAPVVEAAVGLYGGLPSGALAVDALASASLLPTGEFDDFRVDPQARRLGQVALGLGFGARVGILREAGPLPGISASIMRRDVPTITYGDLAGGDEFQYSVDLRALNLRLVASKRLAFLDAAAGLGWDRYTGDALIRVRQGTVSAAAAPDVPIELRNSRVLAFLNAGVELALLKLVAEVGYQGGRDQSLTTSFQDFDPAKGKLFAGLGLRLGL
jgi:hypothetical protein